MRQSDISRDFNEDNFARLVDAFNTLAKEISFDNMSGQILSATIEAGEEINISHTLKDVPKYRIILRQSAQDSLVTDGDVPWNDKFITLKNHGASDTTVTVFVMRG